MMKLTGATILVVGGAGFVGSNLVKRLLKEGAASVTIVDNLLSADPSNISEDERVDFRRGSIADHKILDDIDDKYEIVFHLATFHGNESSIHDPLADHANNLVTTLNLFEHLKSFKRLRRVVYSSTGCALAPKGEVEAEAVCEDGPIPIDYDSPYQISKVVGEMYATYFHHRHRLPVVRARFQNVYGPSEILGAGEWRGTSATIWRNVVPIFVYRALKSQPLQVHGRGEATRDFIYVEDIVSGLIRCALTHGIEGDVFNLASGHETSIRRLAEAVNLMTKNEAGIKELPMRDWDRSIHRFGSTEKSERLLRFKAQTLFDDGLKLTVNWARQNLSLIDRCIQQHHQFYTPLF